MSHQSQLIETDILAYLKAQEHKSLLRFITCGSVDDGKSTLIGRLLYESKLIYEDQLAALESDSKKVGTQGDQIDFALLVDGLAAEREQGITIDVAYRYFSTDKRKFIVADTPGHEQYTRNMATGASTAQLAILMVDARHGIMTQTKRHSTIVQLLGVKKIVLAINKMDLVDFSESRFNEIVDSYKSFAKDIGITEFKAIPVSALKGDNITQESINMNWYAGVTLMEYLETVPLDKENDKEPFSMPVQWVNRPHLDFRGFAGQITTGQIAVGDEITVVPAQVSSKVKSIVTFEKELKKAHAGQSITLTLEDEIDASRGDVMISQASNVQIANSFKTTLLWMSEEPMVPQKSYWIKTRAKSFTGTINTPNFKLNVNTQDQCEAKDLKLNEIGECDCEFDQDIPFEPYTQNKHLGSFIIIDRQTNNTVGMGLIIAALSQESWADRHVAQREKYWSKGLINVQQRVSKHNHKPLLIVVTGNVQRQRYSDIEKSLEQQLFEKDISVYRYGFQYLRSADQKRVSVEELRQEMFKQLLDMAYAFLDSGMVFITAIRGLTTTEVDQLNIICKPFEVLIINLEKQTEAANLVCTHSKLDADQLTHILKAIKTNE